jgi:CRISPR-associated protein Cas1
VLRPSLLQTLYVGEPGVLVTKEHDRCIVSRRKEVLASVPLGQLDQIAVLENALVSTALLRACAARRIAVAFSGHGGELVAIERGALGDQALVAAQWRAQGNGELHMLFARQFIEGKLHNARTVLRRFTRRDGRNEIHQHLLGIDDCQYRLASAPNLATLRGLEGSAARHYFAALRTLLPEGVDFPSRSRRPPADPVNAMLSLGYAVLDHNLHTLLRLAGLNPHLGHLHSAAPGNLALVSDLIEEFRAPVVDAVVLTMWRQREVRCTDFDLDPAADLPCRMRSDARRRFVAALEAKLESNFVHPRLQQQVDFRRAMQAQVEHYKRVLLRQQVVYQPLKLR